MVLLQDGGSLGEQNFRQVVVIFVLERDADDLPGNISGRVEIFIGHLRHNFLFKDIFLQIVLINTLHLNFKYYFKNLQRFNLQPSSHDVQIDEKTKGLSRGIALDPVVAVLYYHPEDVRILIPDGDRVSIKLEPLGLVAPEEVPEHLAAQGEHDLVSPDSLRVPAIGADHREAHIERDLETLVQSFWQILVIIESGNHRSVLVNLETEQ